MMANSLNLDYFDTVFVIHLLFITARIAVVDLNLIDYFL